MRILMLGWELPPHNSGGLGVACYQLSRALASQGAQIDFVLPFNTPVDDAEFMTVHHVSNRSAGLAQLAYSGDFHALRPVQDEYQAFLSDLLDRTDEPPQVIHAHDWLTYEAGIHAKKITGAPLIAHVHATEFDRAGGGYGNPIIHEIELHGLLMADRIIAVSHATKRLIVEKYKIPASKIEVIHNSVDTDTRDNLSVSDKTMYAYVRSLQAEGYLAVMTIGRLTLQKGLTYFLQACAKAAQHSDHMVFIIAGDGEQRNELIGLSAELGIADRVLFTGFVRGAAWRELYDIADVFVMSSVSEPFGLTALEAAVHDTAIMLSYQSGVGEVLTNVLKADYWDVDKMADQLVNVASSDALRHELAWGAQRNFATISWTNAAEKCLTHYKALAAGANA
jgi:glycogen(starch) synthase